MTAWTQKLDGILWDGVLMRDCPMASYTTFRIGGPAAALLDAGSENDILTALAFARENGVRAFVMGNGSNLLVRDEGFDGLIIRLGGRFANIDVQGDRICAQAGALLSALCQTAIQAGLSGLEFAGGIPGSVGGAVYMNAGAYGGQMADCTVCARVLFGGEIQTWDARRLAFSYRHSALAQGGIVLGAQFALTPGDPAQIAAQVRAYNAQRREKQPLNLPSAGSAFKRPKGAFAAALIDQCALKGYRVGGAQVSPKHAGFIVNTGGATAADVLALCRHVQQTVQEQTGYVLEREFIVL